MIITCNNCNSRFNIDEKLIKPQGSKVKCSKCQAIFVVYPPAKEEEIPLPKPPVMPPLLDDDEESGVDIEKDFAPKSNRPARKPMFEEPDVVGGGGASVTFQPPGADTEQTARTPRRVPSRLEATATSGTDDESKNERPSKLAPRRTVPPAAASSGAPKRTMAAPGMPETKAKENAPAEEDNAFTDTVKAAYSGKDKLGGPRQAKEKTAPKQKTRSRSGGVGLKKLLLLIIIIIILLLIAAFALPKFGIEVPLLDKLNLAQFMNGGPAPDKNDIRTPSLPNRDNPPSSVQAAQNGDNGGIDIPVYDSTGILHFYINPELVNSGILGNTSSGIIIIVEGLLQNNYDEPRKAVKIAGRLYKDNDNYELEQEKVVFAGNLLTEEELVSLNPMEIENRLFNNGREFTVPAKSNVPFMIVFTNIPEPISSYRYECELISSESAGDAVSGLPVPVL